MGTGGAQQHFWESLQGRLLAVLDAVVPPGSVVAYADYPVYPNVGDLLIYLAVERWFVTRRHCVVRRWHTGSRWPRRLPSDTVIVCQGGGNFGDLYPKHQALRERVTRRFPQHRIVFLPQTVHFRDPAALARSAGVLQRHPNLHVLVRDSVSLSALRQALPHGRLHLVPDMATLLYPLQDTMGPVQGRRKATGTLCLLRNDCEIAPALENQELVGSCTWKGDWQELLGFRYWQLKSASFTAATLGWALPSKAFAEAWLRDARLAASHCMSAFLCYERVVTSRLHGHILAALLGIPSVLLDNSYGKNAAYFAEWHRLLETAGSAAL